jgi:YD repeat-containing protein
MVTERIAHFGVPLDARDTSMIDRYRAEFVADGLETRYSSLGRNNRFDYPSFGQLIAETDRAGHQTSYLASDDAFQVVRAMEVANRIVPVTGNVAGDRAMAAIARYIAAHGLQVSAFYLSNVEQYLLTREGGFAAYARNVDALPRDAKSVIIRSYFGRFGRSHPLAVPGHNSTSMIETIDSFVKRYRSGQIVTYADLVFSGFIAP